MFLKFDVNLFIYWRYNVWKWKENWKEDRKDNLEKSLADTKVKWLFIKSTKYLQEWL